MSTETTITPGLSRAARTALAVIGAALTRGQHPGEALESAGLLFDPDRARALADAARDQGLAEAEATVIAVGAEDGSTVARTITARCAARIRGLITTATDSNATELVVYRAEHPESGITLGTYTTRAAARQHCTAVALRETPSAHLTWVPEHGGPDAADDLCTWTDDDPEDVCPTGYVVRPVTVRDTYDEGADE
ncbi:hypothetical protein [Streptomyces sp. URMC 129]|uniref:hypothetical protein n=1 Tax=Streptomyces sp. URMC 129 TaxID=3423407 RepID=UPI003F1B441D